MLKGAPEWGLFFCRVEKNGRNVDMRMWELVDLF